MITLLTYIIPVLLVIIAIVPALAGGSAPPAKQCFFMDDELYFEDTGEAVPADFEL